jgi:hypothetical protein
MQGDPALGRRMKGLSGSKQNIVRQGVSRAISGDSLDWLDLAQA